MLALGTLLKAVCQTNRMKYSGLILLLLFGSCLESDPPVPEPEFIEAFDAGHLEVIGGTSEFLMDASHMDFTIWFDGEGHMETYGSVEVDTFPDVGGTGYHYWIVRIDEGVCNVHILEGTYNLETDPVSTTGPSWFKAWGDGYMWVNDGGSIKHGNHWYGTPWQGEF